jgi:hypothetical protein
MIMLAPFVNISTQDKNKQSARPRRPPSGEWATRLAHEFVT